MKNTKEHHDLFIGVGKVTNKKVECSIVLGAFDGLFFTIEKPLKTVKNGGWDLMAVTINDAGHRELLGGIKFIKKHKKQAFGYLAYDQRRMTIKIIWDNRGEVMILQSGWWD